MNKQKGIAHTWIRLEKYLAEFETEEEQKFRELKGEDQIKDIVSLARPTTAFSSNKKSFNIRSMNAGRGKSKTLNPQISKNLRKEKF